MSWMLVAAVLLATAGLLVLGVLAIRLWLDVRVLAKGVDRASRALAAAAEDLADAVPGPGAPAAERSVPAA
ncbi:hypothetical protein ACFU7Y_21020 [Kitasatospora sp. NPDC057542]|uniref:hypothetical protein n=1 Tax=Streptomycetaceae TaxID=2062 RepID=UPI001CCEF036|nr:hypothetical protein [Streptomyces sp. LS1784]